MKTLKIVGRAPIRVFLSKIVDCFDESDVLKLINYIEPCRFHFEIPSFHEDENLKVEERETYYKIKKVIKIEERLERLVITLDKTIHNEKSVNIMAKRIENAMKDIEKIIEIYRIFNNLAKNNFYESELIEKYLIEDEAQIDEDLLSTIEMLDRYVEIEIKSNHKLGPKEVNLNIFNFLLENILEKYQLNYYNEFSKPETTKKILEIAKKLIDLSNKVREYRNTKYETKIEEYDF